MCILDNFIYNLQEFLIGKRFCDDSIIRKHSRRLEQLGDISFPLNIKSWHHLIEKLIIVENNLNTILEYKSPNTKLKQHVEQLIEESKHWQISIEKVIVNDNDIHLFLRRSSSFFKAIITNVLKETVKYGAGEVITKKLTLNCADSYKSCKFSEINLSTLRLLILKDVSLNLVNFTSSNKSEGDCSIMFTLSSGNQDIPTVFCGPVLNEKGVKNCTTAETLISKRTSDMRMIAQHRYRVQLKPNTSWKSYFEKLGEAAVTIEMLSNKPQKPLKVTTNNVQTANKGAAFIFYNCARLAVLFKELEKRIANNVYPELPDLNEVNFSLLTQPEEWELFFVYILQFPITVKNCVKDIEKGILNPQYLISFLSDLSSVFSTYYRRVKILTDPREHLFGTLHARVYLLKALECIFHNALHLLNIEPIKEM